LSASCALSSSLALCSFQQSTRNGLKTAPTINKLDTNQDWSLNLALLPHGFLTIDDGPSLKMTWLHSVTDINQLLGSDSRKNFGAERIYSYRLSDQ